MKFQKQRQKRAVVLIGMLFDRAEVRLHILRQALPAPQTLFNLRAALDELQSGGAHQPAETDAEIRAVVVKAAPGRLVGHARDVIQPQRIHKFAAKPRGKEL